MASTIELRTEAGQAKKELKNVAGAMGDVKDAATQAGSATDAAFDQADASIAELRDGVQECKDELQKLEGTAEDTAASVAKVADDSATLKANTYLAAAGGIVQILEKITRIASIARDQIKAFADAGNEDFRKLDEGISKIEESFGRFTERVANSSTGKGTTGFFAWWSKNIAGGIDALHEFGDTFETLMADMARQYAEFANAPEAEKFWRDRITQIHETRLASEEAFQAEMKIQRVRAQTAAADKTIADFEKSRAEAAEAAAIQQITDATEINRLIAEEIRLLKERSAQDQLGSDQLEKAKKRLTDLETRRMDVERDAAAERKRLADEEQRKIEENARKESDARDKAAREAEAARDREARAAEQAAEREARAAEAAAKAEADAAAKLEKEKQAARDKELQALKDQMAKLQALLAGKDPNQQKNFAEDMLAKQDPRDVARAVADRKAAEVEADGGDARDVTRARQRAFRETIQGKTDDTPEGRDRIRQAQMDLANEQMATMRQNGQVAGQMLDALGKNVQETLAMRQELDYVSGVVHQMNAALDGAADRRRHQRSGR